MRSFLLRSVPFHVYCWFNISVGLFHSPSFPTGREISGETGNQYTVWNDGFMRNTQLSSSRQPNPKPSVETMNGHFCSTKSLIYSDVLRVFPSPPLLLSAQSCVPPFTPRTVKKNRRPRPLGVVTRALEEEGKQRKDEGTEMLLESGGDDNREVAAHVQLLASDAFIVKLSARGGCIRRQLDVPCCLTDLSQLSHWSRSLPTSSSLSFLFTGHAEVNVRATRPFSNSATGMGGVVGSL